jgi:hypothetical protein
LGDGPPGFQQGSTCPVVLRNHPCPVRVSSTGLSPALADLPRSFDYSCLVQCRLCRGSWMALQPDACNAGRLTHTSFGLFPVRSPLLGESQLISFPEGTEMFQFPSFATSGLCIQPGAAATFLAAGFPIRRSTDRRLLTAPRGLSQFCHVLLRLLVPRHPPNALNSLTIENGLFRTARLATSCQNAPADGQVRLEIGQGLARSPVRLSKHTGTCSSYPRRNVPLISR